MKDDEEAFGLPRLILPPDSNRKCFFLFSPLSLFVRIIFVWDSWT